MIYTDKLYGDFELSGILEELIHTNVFQRLKKVHQGGAIVLFNPAINHTRYEHSIGVMLLIKKLGGDLKAQIAKECLAKGIIKAADFYEDDFHLIKQINRSIDLQERINELKKAGSENGNLKMKKRNIDPEILVNNQILKLSEIN